ncbi:MAG: hypothetical protein JXB13_16965 [Phycisphaerae bacterium]|nr:hypothetical protein [Phycisphaerae bacterium]
MTKQRHLITWLAVVALGVMTVLTASAQTLYLHYDFNVPPNATDKTNIVDLSSSGFDGVYLDGTVGKQMGYNTGVSRRPGDYALGETFSDQSHVFINGAVFDLPDSLASVTFTFWFKGDLYDGVTASRIFEYWRDDNQTAILHATTSGGFDNFKINLGSSGGMTSTSTAYNADNEWIFVAITYDSVDDEELVYWQGTVTDPVRPVSVHANTYTWEPGDPGSYSFRLANNPSHIRGTTAVMDDFRLYGHETTAAGALSQSALEAIRLENVPTNGLVAHWPADEAYTNNDSEATQVLEELVADDDGTWRNGAEDWTNGVIGTAVGFDGGDDFVAGYGARINRLKGTITHWLYPRANAYYMGYYESDGTGDGFGGEGDHVEIHTARYIDGTYMFQYQVGNLTSVNTDGQAAWRVFSTDAFGADAWALVTATWERSGAGANDIALKIYVNGELQGTQTGTGGQWSSAASTLRYIGRNSNATTNPRRWNGYMDDMALFYDVLTAGEVMALYTLAQPAATNTYGLADKYNVSRANTLFELHRAGSGEATVGDDRWAYADDLNAIAGAADPGELFIAADATYLLLDDSGNGTGVVRLREAAPALVAHWPADEAYGVIPGDTQVLEEIVGDDDGTWGYGQEDWTAGQIGTAVGFDGNSDRVFGYNTTLNRLQGTISHWLNPSANPGGEGLTIGYYESDGTGAGYDGAGSAGDLIELHTMYVTDKTYSFTYQLGQLAGGGNADGQAKWRVDSTNTFEADTWTLVTATWERGGTETNDLTLKIYLNGELETTVSGIGGLWNTNATAYRAMGRPGVDWRFWEGHMDDIAVYDSVLTPTQVRVLYNLAQQSAVDTYGLRSKYNASQANTLFALHAAGGEASAMIGVDFWSYANGLNAVKGAAEPGELFSHNGLTYLLLDDGGGGGGTGLRMTQRGTLIFVR